MLKICSTAPKKLHWEELALEHLMNLQAGLSSLSEGSLNEEEKKEQFQLKREFVLALVEKVLIGKDREMKVMFKLDVLSLLGLNIDSTPNSINSTNSKFETNKSAGIYIRKQSSLRCHRHAVCV